MDDLDDIVRLRLKKLCEDHANSFIERAVAAAVSQEPHGLGQITSLLQTAYSLRSIGNQKS